MTGARRRPGPRWPRPSCTTSARSRRGSAPGLGTFARVAATVAGPRTARFRTYHDHEAIGARLAEAAGSDPVTVALIEGVGPAALDLRAADDL